MSKFFAALAVLGTLALLALPVPASADTRSNGVRTTDIANDEFSSHRRWRYGRYGYYRPYYRARYYRPYYGYYRPYYRPWRYGYYRPWRYYRPYYGFYRPYYGFYRRPVIGIGFWW